MIRVNSSQNIPNKDLSSGPNSRWTNAKCEEKISGFGDRFYTQARKEWNKHWNCDLKTGVNCGLSEDKFEEISCCMSFDALDRMSEELKKAMECNASDIKGELNVLKIIFINMSIIRTSAQIFDWVIRVWNVIEK